MGRQRGIVHLSGQFDDTQLSIDGKNGIAKLSVPISKERISKSPEFEGTRKVNAEFRAASLATDTLQRCMSELGFDFGDRYLRSRLQTQLITMVRNGSGDAGERQLEVFANRQVLKEVPLDLKQRFLGRFRGRYVITVNADRNTATMTVPSFMVRRGVFVPGGATHFRVFLGVGVLSDYQYVGGKLLYEPVNPDINGLSELINSSYMVAKGDNAGFQLIAPLPALPILPSSAALVVTVGIEFFYEVNGNQNLKAMGNAMQIQGLY
jgi:hypothetical protein